MIRLTGHITSCISGNSSDYSFEDCLPLRAWPLAFGVAADWLPVRSRPRNPRILAGLGNLRVFGILPVYPSNKTDRKVRSDIQ